MMAQNQSSNLSFNQQQQLTSHEVHHQQQQQQQMAVSNWLYQGGASRYRQVSGEAMMLPATAGELEWDNSPLPMPQPQAPLDGHKVIGLGIGLSCSQQDISNGMGIEQLNFSTNSLNSLGLSEPMARSSPRYVSQRGGGIGISRNEIPKKRSPDADRRLRELQNQGHGVVLSAPNLSTEEEPAMKQKQQQQHVSTSNVQLAHQAHQAYQTSHQHHKQLQLNHHLQIEQQHQWITSKGAGVASCQSGTLTQTNWSRATVNSDSTNITNCNQDGKSVYDNTVDKQIEPVKEDNMDVEQLSDGANELQTSNSNKKVSSNAEAVRIAETVTEQSTPVAVTSSVTTPTTTKMPVTTMSSTVAVVITMVQPSGPVMTTASMTTVMTTVHDHELDQGLKTEATPSEGTQK